MPALETVSASTYIVGKSPILHEPRITNTPTNSLEEELDMVERSSAMAGDWYLLPQTGFDVSQQLATLQDTLRRGVSTRDFGQLIGGTIGQMTEDINAFLREYIEQRPYLPAVYEVQDRDGEERVVAPRYDNKLLTQLATPQERNGAVTASLEEIEGELLTLPSGSLIVRTSPPGWSGFPGRTYEDTQTQILEVVGSGKHRQIRNHTVRTGMDAPQNAQLLSYLGVARDEIDAAKTEEDYLSLLSRKFAKIDSRTHNLRVQDIIKIIGDITGGRYHNDTTTADILHDIDDFDELLNLDEKAKRFVQEFSDYSTRLLYRYRHTITEGDSLPSELVEKLQKALGWTIIKLSRAYRPDTKSQILSDYHDNFKQTSYYDHHPTDMNLSAVQRELDFLQSLPGCAGGRSKSTVISGHRIRVELITPWGPRQALVDVTELNKEENTHWHPGKCDSCGNDPTLVGDCNICQSCVRQITLREEIANSLLQ